MIISAIVAHAQNRVIGIDNKLPWHLPKDLKWFKDHTRGRHVIMGRKSFESLPGALPKRTNILITKDKSYYATDAIVKHSIPEALAYAQQADEEEVFILGGGVIYEQTQQLWDKLYLTIVDASPEGDTYFPLIDKDDYIVTFEEKHAADDRNPYAMTFQILERKS